MVLSYKVSTRLQPVFFPLLLGIWGQVPHRALHSGAAGLQQQQPPVLQAIWGMSVASAHAKEVCRNFSTMLQIPGAEQYRE